MRKSYPSTSVPHDFFNAMTEESFSTIYVNYLDTNEKQVSTKLIDC